MTSVPAPVTLTQLFVTEVYRTELGGSALDPLITRLDEACRKLAAEDKAGQAWADAQGYLGYTSYDSMDDLTSYAPVFAELKAVLDVQAALYARILDMDLRGKELQIQRNWVNILRPGGFHSGHIHPNSVVSGTLYISVPDGSGALQFEDPRLTQMMHAPLRHTGTRQDRQIVVPMAPARGTLLLWESWLRHDVPTNLAKEERISISFNYDL